jgi:hypothetical protein
MLRVRGVTLSTAFRLVRRSAVDFDQPLQVFLAIADHFEPMWRRPAASIQQERADRWAREYPRSVAGIQDSLGRPPQHTFFWPADEYSPQHVDPIADLCRQGFGDVEVHLHHDNDTPQGFRDKIERFTETLSSRHGLLARNEEGLITYGFVHGNWALCNSRPDGRWCGVNDELTILRQTGCYADFTMPAAPDPCQTTIVNSIYYAKSDPHRPAAHNRGVPAQVGTPHPEDALLLIQGPLALDWKHRKWGILPRLENADLTAQNPPTLDRLRLWCAAGVHVKGRPDWLFVKLHTHGAQEANTDMLLGEPMRAFHHSLRSLSEIHPSFCYYYVTTRQLATLVHQAEQRADDLKFPFHVHPTCNSPC